MPRHPRSPAVGGNLPHVASRHSAPGGSGPRATPARLSTVPLGYGAARGLAGICQAVTWRCETVGAVGPDETREEPDQVDTPQPPHATAEVFDSHLDSWQQWQAAPWGRLRYAVVARLL